MSVGNIKAMVLDFLNSPTGGALRRGLKEQVSQQFQSCGIEGCGKHSLGQVCRGCSRFVCLGHFYLSAEVPPEPVCVACIAEEHRQFKREVREREQR